MKIPNDTMSDESFLIKYKEIMAPKEYDFFMGICRRSLLQKNVKYAPKQQLYTIINLHINRFVGNVVNIYANDA